MCDMPKWVDRITTRLTVFPAACMEGLAVGILLGVLVAAPYDRLFGLSVPLCMVLRSFVSTVAFASFP